jgi:hypothetical protein
MTLIFSNRKEAVELSENEISELFKPLNSPEAI